MNWITVNKLQRHSGLSWMVCESIIGEQISLVRKRTGWQGALIAVLYLCALLWGLGGLGWLWPALPHHWQLLLRIPGLVLMVFSWFVLPRLLAGDAILAAARAYGDQASAGASRP